MADLNALIAQGAQFHAPVDPFAQYAKMQQLQQGQQANMLNQMKMDEYQRGIAEQNALRGLYSSGLDQASPEFTSKLGAISPTAAQAHQKSMLEASKAKADIAKAQEDVRASQNKALGQGLLIALKDPSDAGLDQAFSLLDAQKIDTKPFRAQFANITDPAQRKSLIQSYVTGTEEGRKALEFVQPKPEKIDLGGKLVTIDINPNSPTFKQQITEFAKTASPDAVLQSETTKRGQNLTDARAREQLAQGKVPAGYRLKADGSLEFIPGGPADPAAGGGKPLPEAAQKQVVGARNLQDAIDGYMQKLGTWGNAKMISPDSRAEMGNAYNNMMLQAKEAYNLGVLNGPDYAILQSVVKDPTKMGAVLTSNKALAGQAESLKNIAASIEKTVMESHGKKYVPRDNAKSDAKPKTPAAGTVQDGYRFKGGDPAVQSNWEKL